MSRDSHAQPLDARQVADRARLGPYVATIALKAGANYGVAFVSVLVATGCVALLVALGKPEGGGAVARTAAIGLFTLFLLAVAASSISSGRALHGRKLHQFERGMVAETKQGPIALPYDDILVYREQTNTYRGGARQVPGNEMYTSVTYRIERRNGPDWENSADAGPEAAAAYELALQKACEAQVGPDAATLANGGTLSYGPVEMDRYRLEAPGVDLAWAEMTSLDLQAGKVTVTVPREGRFVKESVLAVGTVGQIPNFAVFWAIAQQAYADKATPPTHSGG